MLHVVRCTPKLDFCGAVDTISHAINRACHYQFYTGYTTPGFTSQGLIYRSQMDRTEGSSMLSKYVCSNQMASPTHLFGDS